MQGLLLGGLMALTPQKEKNCFPLTLCKGFQQIINEPTHIQR